MPKLPGKPYCYRCYVDYYAGGGYGPEKQQAIQQANPWTYRFSALPDSKADAGRYLYTKLASPITAPGKGLSIKDAAQVGYLTWEPNLDAFAKLLSTGTCTALCVFDRSWTTMRAKLIVAENNQAPDVRDIEKQLPAIEEASQLSIGYVIILDAAGPRIWDRKARAVVASSYAVDARPDVHAELRILEYLHLCLADRDEVDPFYYIGIDKASCAKCETVFRAYNLWQDRRFIAVNQGFHDSYDFHWHIPRGLAALKATINYRVLKNALSP